MYFLWNMGIFHCYVNVRLPEGMINHYKDRYQQISIVECRRYNWLLKSMDFSGSNVKGGRDCI